MAIFEKMFARLGYFKEARIASLFRGDSQFISEYGADQPQDFERNLTAYQNEVWVYACVYLIATTIAGLPWRLYKKKVVAGKVTKEEIHNDEVYKLFERPNNNDENSTWFSLIEWTVANLELVGNAFWLLDETYGNPRKPKSLQVLPTASMRVIPGTQKGELVKGYSYSLMNGTRDDFKKDEVTHFKYMSANNPLYGQGSLCPAAWSIDSIKEAQKSNLNIFRNGLKIDSFFETDQPVNDASFKRLQEQIAQRYKGPKNHHKSGILEKGLKYKVVTGNMAEMEFINGIKLSQTDICAVFQVPPPLVGILDRATYSNMEQAIKMFMVFGILPKLSRVEQVITTIVKRFDKNLYFEFNVSNIDALKDDEKLRSEIVKNYFSVGIPLNTIIDTLNLPFGKVKGGDVGFLPFNLMPITQAAEGKPEPSASAPPVDENDEDDTDDEDDGKALSKSFYTPEKKEFLSKQFDRQLTLIEKRYEKTIGVYFTGLEMDILAKLRRVKGWKSKEDATGEEYWCQKAPRVESIIFNEEEEALKWSEQSGKFHKVAFTENAKREFANLGLSGAFDVFNPAAVKFLDTYSLTMAKSVVGTNFNDVKSVLQAGFEDGLGIDDIARNIQNVYEPFTDAGYKARRIAQTEVLGASNEGAVQSYEQAALQGVNVKKGWLPSYNNTRDTHIQAGATYSEAGAIPVREDFQVGGGSGNAPGLINVAGESINCFPGFVLAESISPVSFMFRRYYEGDVITIKTADGIELTGTPNHPVLTEYGWIALGELVNGINVISSSFGKQMTASNPNKDNYPAAIAKLFKFSEIAGTLDRVTGTERDFHGDGMDSDVNIVSVDGKLGNSCNTPILQPSVKDIFSMPDTKSFVLPNAGTQSQFSNSSLLSPNGVMGGGRQSVSADLSDTVHPVAHSIASISSTNSVLNENPSNNGSARLERIRKRLFGFSRQITLDKIINIVKGNFCGHVYNLQSKRGRYLAGNSIQNIKSSSNSIIVHNCHCTTFPVVEK